MPVRVGMVRIGNDLPESLQSPIYATGYGLLKQVIKQQNYALDTLDGPAVARIFTRMKSWVMDFF